MDDGIVRSISTGLSQKGVRDHNERLLLSLLLRHGELAGSDLARLSGLSAPTVSGILRRLETEGLLSRRAPVRGRVGKPSVPMALAPDGVLSLGLKIGRRSAELLLMEFTGGMRRQLRLDYDVLRPGPVLDFLTEGLGDLCSDLSPAEALRLCGLGIAAPFEIWNASTLSLEFPEWSGTDLRAALADITALPVLAMNDATAACLAEQIYGRGKEFRDYAYFFVGSYLGGGIVLNHSLYEGHRGNAGALGSLRTIGPNGESRQLVDMASLHLLQTRLRDVGLDPARLSEGPKTWAALARHVEPWLGETAQELAKASLSTCSVIDFEAILIDGAFPETIRHQLVERVRRYLATQDTRGLIVPRIEAGRVGGNARTLGAASGPIVAQYLLNTNTFHTTEIVDQAG
ncbi:MAG: ROK family transcriptional regulator [Jannaschia helgolandensis]|uniref:Transcriptional regulator, MarR family n=1 Tax=Jannaschia helgolandensis TaxID=188906 RepID=A0A1H7QEA5_9RHOB|nr:ROK family transcriptional regulator [Jannaschia helgolandensis]SEL45627.1 transcriptional regulator, MarR family [Jannaschia helgolandensis]|tara:strand:+ start:476 stop:1681 length:1206 start_codon:yes stop_codon:yes gene_type:complete